MIKKITNIDRKIIEYIYRYPYFNTYLISDIEVFGITSDVISLYSCEEANTVYCILMQYGNSFVVYSQNPKFINKRELYTFFANIGYIKTITGEYSTISEISSLFSNCDISNNTYSILYPQNITVYKNNNDAYKLVKHCDYNEVIDIYRNINEFCYKYKDYEEGKNRIITNNMNGRYYGIKHDGKLVSVVCSAAESSKTSMISEVGTLIGYRNRNLSKIVVSELCNDLFKEGKEYVTIFYNSEIANSVYKKIGFENIGLYSMLSNIR